MLALLPSADGLAPPPLPRLVGVVLGLPAGAVAALVAWAFGGAPTAGVVLAAAAAAALAVMTTPVGALIGAAQCWACADGFVLHRFGTLADGRADLVALAVVAGAACAAQLLATAARRARTTGETRSYPAVDVPCTPGPGRWPIST